MTTETNNNETENKQREEETKKLITAIYSRSLQMLQVEFDNCQVEGQIMNHPAYGPLFVYRLKDTSSGNEYACGFLINELLEKHKDAGNAQQWLASFFVDMVDVGADKPLPKPPTKQEETKKLVDEQIVPYCIKAVRQEFMLEKVYTNLGVHEKVGPVLEAGFPAFKDGNNVVAIPLQYLMTLYLLNRDPAEPLVNGLYKIREERGLG